MKHKLKIEMEYEEEGIDSDGTPITNATTRVSLDDEPIGCIQKIEIKADKNNHIPEIKFYFFDLAGPGVDPAYKNPWKNQFDWIVKELNKISNVDVILTQLDYGNKVNALSEIGTDGIIGLVPMMKRYEDQ